MKKLIQLQLLLLASFALVAGAQNPQPAQPTAPTFIKGTIGIQFNSRVTKGAPDVYSVNVNVCNSALFHGTVTDTPLVMGGWTGPAIAQPRSLYYDVACDVVNPKMPSQTVNVGRMFGKVPISLAGTYQYDAGTLEVSVLPRGQAGGFDSRFSGQAIGKPLNRPANWLETLKCSALNITRSVNGKTMTVTLSKYDKLEFRQCVIGAGPSQNYQPLTVNGEILYDYDKSCWFFNNVTAQYAVNGSIKYDRFTGTIRWVEDADRENNGVGEYQFDIRVNEPPPNENAAFAAASSDESTFFEVDTAIPAITGTMKYKDTLRHNPTTTLSSAVTLNLTGNSLKKEQVMAFCKIFVFSAIVPVNAD